MGKSPELAEVYVIDVVFSLPQGTNIEDTLEAVKVVEARLTSLPEVVSVLTIVGKNGEENATVTANLKPSAERERGDD